MKKSIMLITTMLISLIAFSQKDTIPTTKCFPVPIVRLITKDLLSGDSAKALLKLTEQQLDSTIRKTYIQDSVIGVYKQKEENFNNIISNERQKFGTLQTYTNRIEKKNKILGFTNYGLIVIVGIVAFLLK